jgi:hypothetical protein
MVYEEALDRGMSGGSYKLGKCLYRSDGVVDQAEDLGEGN